MHAHGGQPLSEEDGQESTHAMDVPLQPQAEAE